MLIIVSANMPNEFDKKLKEIESQIEDIELKILKLQLEIDYLKVLLKKGNAKKQKLLSHYNLRSYF